MQGQSFVGSWQAAGPHRYVVEGDRIRWESLGAVEPEQAHVFAQLLLRVSAERGHAFALVDGRKMLPLPSESRRIYLDYLKKYSPHFSLAIFGAPLHIRVAGMLVLHAARLMALPPLDVCYTATEADAEQFLSDRRQHLA